MTAPRPPDTDALFAAILTRLAEVTTVPVFAPKLPTSPDTAIGVDIYNVDTSRDPHSPDVYVQLRFRTPGDDVRTTHRLADQVYAALDDLLNERSNTTWGDVAVLTCHRHIRGMASPDGNGRYTRPDSYTLTVNPS